MVLYGLVVGLSVSIFFGVIGIVVGLYRIFEEQWIRKSQRQCKQEHPTEKCLPWYWKLKVRHALRLCSILTPYTHFI